jgi:hypothetical protein
MAMFCMSGTADGKLTSPTVLNGFLYQFTTEKSLKTVEKVSIILQSAVCRGNPQLAKCMIRILLKNHGAAILIIIEKATKQLPTVFSTSLLLETRWKTCN